MKLVAVVLFLSSLALSVMPEWLLSDWLAGLTLGLGLFAWFYRETP